MFANFLYYIIALLIVQFYLPMPADYFNPLLNTGLFLLTVLLFWLITGYRFKAFERKMTQSDHAGFDFKYDSLIKQQSILAVVIFAIDIHLLHLPMVVGRFALFRWFPSLEDFFFFVIFLIYLIIVWDHAHDVHKRLFKTEISRKSFLFSHISFAVPVLAPWLLLAILIDLVQLLPFGTTKQLIASPTGQFILPIVFLILIALVGPALIQRFWRCRPMEDNADRRRIERLCVRAGIEYNRILYWPVFGGQMITAGVLGLVKRFRYILVTQGLLRYLDENEVDAVIAHEIGHVKKKHLLQYLIILLALTPVIFLSSEIFAITRDILFSTVTPVNSNQKNFSILAYFLVFSEMIFYIVPFVIYLRYIFGYFMRNFERQADIFVFELFESARPLITTFQKIVTVSGQTPEKPNWHHFSIKERMDYLMACELDRRWIKAHEMKLKRSMFLFIAGIILISGLGVVAGYGYGEVFKNRIIEKNIDQRLSENPDNLAIVLWAAGKYHEFQRYQKAIDGYTKYLNHDPHNAVALNGLAWLYATCDDLRFRNPLKALELAILAVKQDRSASVLDTLAESYYVNGRYDKAIEIEKEAIGVAEFNKFELEERLQKYHAALLKQQQR